jgi:hypothetical protein
LGSNEKHHQKLKILFEKLPHKAPKNKTIFHANFPSSQKQQNKKFLKKFSIKSSRKTMKANEKYP